MKTITFLILLICSFGYSQHDGLLIRFDATTETYLSGDIADFATLELSGSYTFGNEDSETITKIEVVNDSLYVYKSIQPDLGISCAVMHYDDICSWTLPRNARDVYALVDGKMKMIKTQHPKRKWITKEINETIEYWGN